MTDFSRARQRMVDSQLRARNFSNARVLEAMLRVPREMFVPEIYRSETYEDRPLPIGDGQTISQPYVVAVMLDYLQLLPTDVVLEVGTGSGYATALLAELAAKVVSIERHVTLVHNSRQTLASLGYRNVEILKGDGTEGLPSQAPFDAILVSAAALQPPPTLISQLREGGRMIVPVGTADFQQLQLIRIVEGQPVVTQREPVRFVPLISEVK